MEQTFLYDYPNMQEIVLSKAQIQSICERVGAQLSGLLKDEKKAPVFVGVMRGALRYYFDLIDHINIPLIEDFVQTRSWEGLSSTGNLVLDKDLSEDVEGRSVVIIDDVVESGLSMDYLVKHIEKRNPKRIIVCCLIDKPFERKIPVKVDYPGYVMEKSKFLMGYGLDYYERYRNTPYVYVPSPDEVESWDKAIEKEKE